MEDLEINNMMKNRRLSRSIQESIWGGFKRVLACKAESAGKKFICVPPHYTSQTCSRCLNTKESDERLTLKDRTYHCKVCGLVMDRDENASIVIKRVGIEGLTLKRARAGRAQSNAQGDSDLCDLKGINKSGLGTENILNANWGSPQKGAGD
jgi:putative transposase